MKKSIFLVLWGVGVLAMVLGSPSMADAGGRRRGEMPAPRLLMPHDSVDLSGKTQLEFTWGNESGGSFDHYDFRLYQGPQTYEKYLILQKKIPAGTTTFLLDTNLLKVGEVYSWSLRYVGQKKSLSSFSVFKVKS